MIKNARDIGLKQAGTGLPRLDSALLGWFYPLTLGRAQKTNVDGLAQEIITAVQTRGVIQPLSARQLAIKPEGQRAWRWISCYCLPDVILAPDDIVTIDAIRYRVMAVYDFRMEGFMHYELCQDYQEGVA